jgi:hypothetical protein
MLDFDELYRGLSARLTFSSIANRPRPGVGGHCCSDDSTSPPDHTGVPRGGVKRFLSHKGFIPLCGVRGFGGLPVIGLSSPSDSNGLPNISIIFWVTRAGVLWAMIAKKLHNRLFKFPAW